MNDSIFTERNLTSTRDHQRRLMEQRIIQNYLGRFTIGLRSDYAIDSFILENGSWEPHLVALFNYFVKQGFTCVDAGANTGIHTLALASLVGPSGKVVAFEPSPEYSTRIGENIRLNPSLASRIEVHRSGLSDEAGTLKLFESGEKAGNAYMAKEYDSTLWNRFAPDIYTECPVIPLDTVIPTTKVDLIKIDVEGMEAKVFSGAMNIIRRDKPILIYETLVDDFGVERTGKMNTLVNDEGYYQFSGDRELQKLTRCHFPNLPEDVVAIHPDRLLSATPILHNCARYVFSGHECANTFGGDMFLTVACLARNTYAICWSAPGDDSPAMKIAFDDGRGNVCFEQVWNNEILVTTSQIISHTRGEGREICAITATIFRKNQRIQLNASLLGGQLRS